MLPYKKKKYKIFMEITIKKTKVNICSSYDEELLLYYH